MFPKTHYKLLRQWEFRAQMSHTCDVCLVDKGATREHQYKRTAYVLRENPFVRF